MNPQNENSQTDKKSENVERGSGRANPLRSEVTTNQINIHGSIGVSSADQEAGMYVEADIHQVKCKLLVDTAATVSIVSNDMYQTDVHRPTLTSTNQDVLTASGDKLKIVGRGNFLKRLDDTKDMVVQALLAQITVDGDWEGQIIVLILFSVFLVSLDGSIVFLEQIIVCRKMPCKYRP